MSIVTTNPNSTTIKTCWDWDDGNIQWNSNPYYWDEVCLVKKITSGATGDGSWNEGYNQLKPKEKKRFVMLMARITNNPIYKSSKPINEIKVKTKDIKITVEEVLKASVILEKVKENVI